MKQHEIEKWDRAGLRIRPLLLILDVMRNIGVRFGVEQAYLTQDELIRRVIPLAGDKTTVMEDYISSVFAFRNKQLDRHQWPDCAQEANDKRMAREFLLFLAHYGFCSISPGARNALDKFVIQEDSLTDLQAIIQLPIPKSENQVDVASQMRVSGIAAITERRRVTQSVLERPCQTRFRRSVLEAYRSECLITQERIPETLEAAHIIPVGYRGADTVGNGICLRSDIHSLFDSGHLRIKPQGQLVLSDAMHTSLNYHNLPPLIHIPHFVLPDALEWRWRYQ
jgi:hypothetical protein